MIEGFPPPRVSPVAAKIFMFHDALEHVGYRFEAPSSRGDTPRRHTATVKGAESEPIIPCSGQSYEQDKLATGEIIVPESIWVVCGFEEIMSNTGRGT